MNSFFRRSIVVAVSCVSMVSVYAQTTPPDSFIKQLNEETLQQLKTDKKLSSGDTSHIVAWAEKNVLNNFDFQRMTALAVGKDWRSASAEQKQKLTLEFRTLLVRTYANALSAYKNETVDYKPYKGEAGEKEAVIKTMIIQPGKKPVDVSYSVEWVDNQWKIYDINVAGVSLVTNYRDTFNAEIRNNGIEGLITVLQNKNSTKSKV